LVEFADVIFRFRFGAESQERLSVRRADVDPAVGERQFQAVGTIFRGGWEGALERLHQGAETAVLEGNLAELAVVERQAPVQFRDAGAGSRHVVEKERHPGVAVAAVVHGWKNDAAVVAFPADRRAHSLHLLHNVGLADRRAIDLDAVVARDVVDHRMSSD
jgi:hypothetical protein